MLPVGDCGAWSHALELEPPGLQLGTLGPGWSSLGASEYLLEQEPRMGQEWCEPMLRWLLKHMSIKFGGTGLMMSASGATTGSLKGLARARQERVWS